MRPTQITLATLGLVLLFTLTSAAQGTYTQLDYPGAECTYVHAISKSGVIAGSWGYDGFLNYFGFILKDGVFTDLAIPGSTQTTPTGVNDAGVAVGHYDGGGFIYDPKTKTFSDVYCNGIPATPQGINNAGTIVGSFTQDNHIKGFELIGSTCKVIVANQNKPTTLFGISDAGKILGWSNVRPFYYLNGQFRYITVPSGTLVYGINPAGNELVGSSGFEGFIYQNGQSQTLEFPRSLNTSAEGVNDAGVVVGSFENSGGPYDGYMWTPPSNGSEQ